VRPEDFDFLSSLLKRRSGLNINPEKVYLLESRLTPLARRRGMEGLDALIETVRNRPSEDLLREVTEAMTTNESFFFRDRTPFDLFRDHVLPVLRERRAGKRKIRIWCAACSTGQEPYSLAMLLDERAAQYRDWSFEIIGTDLSRAVLNKAREGLYSQFEVQRGLPIKLLMKYFAQEGDLWRLNKSLRDRVTFREGNLLENFSHLGTFDVVYCRNVLIYFDQPTKSNVLDRIRQVMPTDGTLFLGSAETVLGISDRFRPVRGHRGMYLPSDADQEMLAAASA